MCLVLEKIFLGQDILISAMPLQVDVYEKEVMFPIFDGLISEM